MEKNSLEERVFIIAPLGQDAHVMAELLARHGFETQICGSLKECCAQMKSGAGAFVITEEALQLGDSFEFFETLGAQPPWSEVPLIILTSGGEFRSVRLLELVTEAAGSVTLLERPVGPTTLIRSLEVALNSRLRQYQVRGLLEEQRRNQHQLREAHEQLADRASQLEGLVESRTAKLAESNKKLRREMAEREALRRRLLHAQEEERRRIARELHDQMGQNLTALNVGLKSLLDRPSGAGLGDRVQRLQELATQTARDLHRVAVELRPSALDDLGLVKAIRALADTWSIRYGIDVDFEAGRYQPAGVSSEIETIVYRIIQEALNNVAKHSGATHVAVVLHRTADQVQAIIEDNGRGFDSGAAAQSGNGSGRLGLLGIQERLGTVDGSLNVESAPGSGATLIVRIPIPASA
ncbi:MAG: ATP-binding protein [Nitrospirota bacterium]|jgi:signal transduction histidine kinase